MPLQGGTCHVPVEVLPVEIVQDDTGEFHIERKLGAGAAYEHRFPSRHHVTHPELVEDVWILQGKVGQHYTTVAQLLEHVGVDDVGDLALVGPNGFEPRLLDSALDNHAIDLVEVVQPAATIVERLAPKGHDNKALVRLHGSHGSPFHVVNVNCHSLCSNDTPRMLGPKHPQFRESQFGLDFSTPSNGCLERPASHAHSAHVSSEDAPAPSSQHGDIRKHFVIRIGCKGLGGDHNFALHYFLGGFALRFAGRFDKSVNEGPDFIRTVIDPPEAPEFLGGAIEACPVRFPVRQTGVVKIVVSLMEGSSPIQLSLKSMNLRDHLRPIHHISVCSTLGAVQGFGLCFNPSLYVQTLPPAKMPDVTPAST